ncbi:MAG: solute:Na+ symporter, SSS family [Candidatus Kentron sp. G]|nr:MAG: solute:Na+ symporter, SSS family [Candidatus Kentron sp. G]VFN01693.1 MAG: solute:Na+ symporter, SSS family [Candidatus Kentron sp. G]VFN02638.1 MAG: solute:Na+ symporter, SSS family [Candidatus Kentron sp. G]
MEHSQLSHAVFFVSLLITFSVAVIGRRTSLRRQEDDLAGRSLNRWLIGLSAGATGNSGFVVAGAVGLGYSFGMQWIMLPIAWFLGDLVFWRWFPKRINAFGHKSGVITISEMLRYGLTGPWAKAVSLLAAVVIVVGLSGYTAAQWLAGQKFLSGAFGFSAQTALAMFALLIIAYSSIGGFRGSVYADTFQAVIRLFGTALILGSSLWIASGDWPAFHANIAAAGGDFLDPFPNATLIGAIGFIVGWAVAALGFGLGQPQVMSRYLASNSPAETHAARWIYMGYIQATWIPMTIFGMILRGIMPDISEPEAGLSIFAQTHLFAVVAGIVVADIFAVIASTANSLLIAMAQSIRHDVLKNFFPRMMQKLPLSIITLLIGIGTMMVSMMIGGSVASLALSSISMVGAGLAVPVMIKVMGWRHTGVSLTGAVVIGIASAVAWKQLGFSQYLNEAAVGMLLSAAANWILLRIAKSITE